MTMDRWQAPGKLTNLKNRLLEKTPLDSLAEPTLHKLPTAFKISPDDQSTVKPQMLLLLLIEISAELGDTLGFRVRLWVLVRLHKNTAWFPRWDDPASTKQKKSYVTTDCDAVDRNEISLKLPTSTCITDILHLFFFFVGDVSQRKIY